MNKLNPLYILALVLTILFVSYLSLENKEEEFIKTSSLHKNTQIKAKEFKEFKTTWFDKKRVVLKVNKLIKSKSFKNAKVLKNEFSNLIKIKIQSSNPKILNNFLNRVLNEKLIINKLKVNKESIYLEVGLR